MTLKKIGYLFCATSSFVYHFIAIGPFKLELLSGNPHFGSNSMIFVQCDLEIWGMTLKNNRAPLLCYFKLCASFHSHWSIQTGVTVRKCPNWGKICFNLCDLDLWSLTLAFCMGITFINGNNCWKFHHDLMTETLWKRCHRRTNGRMDIWMGRQKYS